MTPEQIAAIRAATDPAQTEARRVEHEQVKAQADIHDPDGIHV